MGVSIKATNGIYIFDMGYGGFFNLQKNIAIALDQEFGDHYAKLLYCHSKEELNAHDRKSEEIINRKRLDEEYSDVLDFLFASDESGTISHRTCKKIYDLRLDYFNDGSTSYSYSVHRD